MAVPMRIVVVILALLPLLFANQEVNPVARRLIEIIQNDLSEHKVVMYSKTSCSYSKMMKMLLQRYPIPYIKVTELNLIPNGEMMLNYLEPLSGIKTVPQLFVNGTFVGGFTDTQKLENQGKLKTILRSAGVI